jgi:hypothetical protein
MTAAALSRDGSPEPPTQNLAPHKRKLSSLANGVSSAHEALPSQQAGNSSIEGLLHDILIILQRYVILVCS